MKARKLIILVDLEKPFGINVQKSQKFIEKLKKYNVPIAVNFTQASGVVLKDLIARKDNGELGEILGIDIIIRYTSWPRQWQKSANWLRFKKEGGMTREVISHFLFFIERVFGALRVIWAHTSYPSEEFLCETSVFARLETTDNLPVNIFATATGCMM